MFAPVKRRVPPTPSAAGVAPDKPLPCVLVKVVPSVVSPMMLLIVSAFPAVTPMLVFEPSVTGPVIVPAVPPLPTSAPVNNVPPAPEVSCTSGWPLPFSVSGSAVEMLAMLR